MLMRSAYIGRRRHINSDSESSGEAKLRWLVLLTACAGGIRGSPSGLPQRTAPSLSGYIPSVEVSKFSGIVELCELLVRIS